VVDTNTESFRSVKAGPSLVNSNGFFIFSAEDAFSTIDFSKAPIDDGIVDSPLCRVVTATDGQTRPSVTSDKARVRHIRVNGMLTSKRVKPELLCPRWLPHRCHVGSLAITL
jgi:hypothetical protein